MIINKNDRKSIRSVFGKTLAELGKTNKDIVVLDADLSCSTQTQIFATYLDIYLETINKKTK